MTRFHRSKVLAVSMLLTVALLCTGRAYAYRTPAEALSTMDLAAENDYLQLHVNTETTEVAVKDKRTGEVWFTNPFDRSEKETVKRGDAKQEMNSQVSINYYTPDDLMKSRDSFTGSNQMGQAKIVPITDGIRVEFTIGVLWDDNVYVPQMISQERLDAFLERMSPKDRELMLDNYSLVSLVDDGIAEIEVAGLDVDKVFGSRRLVVYDKDFVEQENSIKDQRQQLLEPGLTPDEKDRIEKSLARETSRLERTKRDIIWNVIYKIRDYAPGIELLEQIRWEHLAHLQDNPTYVLQKPALFELRDMIAAMKRAGYTPDDAQKDSLENHLSPSYPNIEVFFVPIEYTLDGESFVVRIPVNEVQYPRDVVDEEGKHGPRGGKVTFPLTTLTVLRYFGAAGVDEEGYILVPDGSGALIHLNNWKLYSEPYGGRVYGIDWTEPETIQTSFREQIHLPVFGMKCGDKAFLAIIEEGDALASVQADVAGRTSSYNTVYPEFDIIDVGRTGHSVDADSFGLFLADITQKHSASRNVYQPRSYEGDIQIRYSFLYGEDADYVGMARFYQDYLVERYGLQRVSAGESIPFYLDLVGAISRNRPVLGVPREVVDPLTTFDQARDIVDALMGRGVSGIDLRYLGWLKGGVKHTYPSRVEPEKSLGGADAFRSLRDYLDDRGVDLFPEVDFLTVSDHGVLGNNGFLAFRDAAKRPDGYEARVYEYNLATSAQDAERSAYVVSPRSLESLVKSFVEDYATYGIPRISLRNMGVQVNSDFSEKPEKLVDRQQAKAVLSEQLQMLSSTAGLKMIIEGGNAFALPYADSVVDVPLGSSQYYITDEDVPFLQIVLHGYVNYAGEAINLSQDPPQSILKSIEVGAYPHYKWAYQASSVVKNTKFDDLYSLFYGDWLDSAVGFWAKANEALEAVQDKTIIGHERIAPDVYMTTYENGVSIVLNYSQTPIEVMGESVGAFSFRVLEEGVR